MTGRKEGLTVYMNSYFAHGEVLKSEFLYVCLYMRSHILKIMRAYFTHFSRDVVKTSSGKTKTVALKTKTLAVKTKTKTKMVALLVNIDCYHHYHQRHV